MTSTKQKWQEGDTVRSKCPSCGELGERRVYDIGSGPELCCSVCDWCWGAQGQPLKPVTYRDVVEALGYDPMKHPDRPLPPPRREK